MKKFVDLLLLLVVFCSCSKDDGTETVPPQSLTYNVDNVFVQNITEVNITPSSSGGAVSNYTITPALPAGLSLNPTTGVISGIATAVLPSTTFTVTATNSGGSTTFDLILTVNAVAPTSLSYTISDAVLVTDTSVVNWIPASSGGVITNYSITPQLPTGMSINPTTGVIAGAPTEGTPAVTYTVTASNSAGSTTSQIVFLVNVSVTTPISRIKSISESTASVAAFGNYYDCYTFTYDNSLLSSAIHTTRSGTDHWADSTMYQYIYDAGKISGMDITGLAPFGIGGPNGWGTPQSYTCGYSGDRIVSIFNNATLAVIDAYTYNSSGQMINTDNFDYQYYPNGNLYQKTSNVNNSSNILIAAYDDKMNPYRLGGFTAEYLSMKAIPMNNPTSIVRSNCTDVYQYVYNTLNYPVKAYIYRHYNTGGNQLYHTITYTYE